MSNTRLGLLAAAGREKSPERRKAPYGQLPIAVFDGCPVALLVEQTFYDAYAARVTNAPTGF